MNDIYNNQIWIAQPIYLLLAYFTWRAKNLAGQIMTFCDKL